MFFFFFSSRRRHTRLQGDWSSDVCSSDLKHCGMGITSFAKHTRQCVNLSPMEFLKQCRLNHAAKQLREQPGASITEICFSNGFNSSQYFATCFRKCFNMSPREFALKHLR